MTQNVGYFRFYWVSLIFSCGIFHIQADEHPSYVYSYCTNVTSINEKKALQNLCGQVTITPYMIGPISIPWTLLVNQSKLLHVKATLGTNPRVPRYVLEAVARFDANNAVDWIYVPDSRKFKIWELNQLKAIISLLIVHPSFESGTITDSSGTCHINYAMVDDNPRNKEIVTVDKEKTKCKGIQNPLDVWNNNVIPIRDRLGVNRMLIRYRFKHNDGTLSQAVGFEQQEIALYDSIDTVRMRLASWQELIFLKQTMHESPFSDGLNELSAEISGKIAEQLMKSTNKIMHLGTLYPVEQTEVACSLNTHLYRLVDDQTNSFVETPVDERLLPMLRNLVENTRNSLQRDQLVQIESLHIVLQLVRLLRCLPDQSNIVELINEATKMAPPAVSNNILYRQYDTWRDRLVDVLVSCGTPNCLTVLLRRLETLTNFTEVTMINAGTLSPEVLAMRKMLFITLWPALAHLKRIEGSFFERLFQSCDKVIDKPARTICLMTIVNLYPVASEIPDSLTTKLIEIVKADLVIPEHEIPHSSPSLKSKTKPAKQNKKTTGEMNSRLLIGLNFAKTLSHPALFPPVESVVNSVDQMPPTIRAFAIQVLPKLLGTEDTNDYFIKVNQLRSRLADQLIQRETNRDDLVIDSALFKTILLLYPSVNEVAILIDEIAIQKRWPLVRICRILLDDACDSGQLVEQECFCLKDYCPGFRTLGYAGGWSGLATGSMTEFGVATDVRGDLLNINDSLLADYSLQLVTGPDGEFRQSNLVVNLLSEYGETRMFEFNVYTEGMQLFTTVSNRRKKVHQSTAWVSVELNYLQTRLPPWTLFDGGLKDVMQLFWSAPNEPTSVLQVTETAVDQRLLGYFGTGWTIRADFLGLFAVQVEGAMETSVWSQSGNSLVRVRFGTVYELRAHVMNEHFELTIPGVNSAFAMIQGFGAQAMLDFVTHVKVTHLPNGICMAMNRPLGTTLMFWEATHPIPELWLRGRTTSAYRELQNAADYQVNQMLLPGVSYNLGQNNSRSCTNLRSRTHW